MNLTSNQLRRIKKDYGMELRYLRPVLADPEHTVSLYKAHGWRHQFGNDHEILVCPCSFDVRQEEYVDKEGNKRIRRIRKSDEFNCKYKREAMQIVKAELREKHGARWVAMTVADAVLDIWEMFKRGTYVGLHNVGMLYTSDLDELLALTPRKVPYIIRSSDGTEERRSIEFPSDTIVDAVSRLKRQKIIELSGNVLMPFKERFCFPDQVHNDIAFIVGDQYGWPNGDAGDCFLWGLYKELVKQTGWTCGEDVFGPQNIPNLTDAALNRCREVWMRALDMRLADPTYLEKGKVFEEIPVEVWRGWLEFVRRDLNEYSLF